MTLTSLLRSKITAVWVVLIFATLLSWHLGADHGAPDARTVATVVIMLVAFIKVRFVGLYFMELRHAPVPLRLIFEGYCLVVCSVVIGLYLGGN